MYIIIIAIVSTYLGISLGVPVSDFTKGSDALKFAPLIDGHNDLPFTIYEITNNDLKEFDFKRNLTNDRIWGKDACKECMTDLPRLRAGKVGAQFWSAYVSCNSQYKDAVQLTLRQIDVIKRLVQKYSDELEFVTEADNIEKVWRKGKIGSMIGVEGGHSLDSSLAILRLYYELGVRYITLTHTCNTPWADGSPTINKPVNNLTDFGKLIVWEMNRLGMLIDLSHVSHNVMCDVLAVTKSPVIFSHSSVFALCNHHRNVPDDVLRQVKSNNGIVMVNFYNGFVNCNKSRNSTLDDVVDHINYITKLIGVDHVGIGADYNGVPSTPEGLEDVSKYPALFDRLYDSKKGEPDWNRDDLEKLAGRNLIRVLKKVEQIRDSLKLESPYEDIINVEEMKIAQEREKLTPGICQTAREWTYLNK
ncbi:dipeptidase 1-like [Phymastichus coffea]|uniref:dipeptidase 1-like n=1 Tax=Phymastichus coffea TaxID=108790 RepID=UPI00273C7197|nr:dipeptidase 1-like [Phymastichus coffea]XP_058789904.1 dipeptidase 1-like [Phymastichus coffea]